jgi:galacturonosyltransferase
MKNIYLISNSYKSFFLFRKEIIKELSRKYNLFLIANNDDYFDYFNSQNIKCIKLENFFNKKNIFLNIFFILRLIWIFIKNKPNLVQTYTIHPNLICLPIAKLFFAKTLAMITGMGSLSVTKNKNLKKLVDLFYKFSFYFCDHIIFVNTNNKKYFHNNLNIKTEYTLINGAGVKKKIKRQKKNFFIQKYNLKNSFNIIFVGRIIKEKGVIDAIKIFKLLKIKNKKLIFAGGFDNSSFSEKISKKLFNYPGIIFLDHLRSTYEVFDLADLFILPSITEGMPTSLMEAINEDIPTVSYNIAGVEDIIKNDLNGVTVRIGEINKVVNKIMQINKDKKYRSNLLANSLKLKNKFDRVFIERKILYLYDNIIKSKN